MKATPTLLLLALLFGCSKHDQPASSGHSTMSGDLGSFLLDHATKHGGHPNTNGPSAIQADWRYTSPNDVQVLIFASGDRFAEIQSLLSHAFGEPDRARGSTPVKQIDSGSRMGWYSLTQIGVSIQFVGWTNQTHVSIMGQRDHDRVG
jgi:hypothetical protein